MLSESLAAVVILTGIDIAARSVRKQIAHLRQECAVAGDYNNCLTIRMRDRDYSNCSASGGFKSDIPKKMPNVVECTFYSLLDSIEAR